MNSFFSQTDPGIQNTADMTMSKIDKKIIISLFALTFILQSIIASMFFERGIYAQIDVIFDSDPSSNITKGAYILADGGLFHPIYYLLNVIIKAPLRQILMKVDATIIPLTMTCLSVYVVIFATCLKNALVYVIFRYLKLTYLASFILTFISILSPSSLIFGSIPDSYPISGFLITLTIYYALTSTQKGFSFAFFKYLLTSFLLGGITITNLSFSGWIHFFKERYQNTDFIKSLIKSVLFVTLISSSLLGTLYSTNSLFSLNVRSQNEPQTTQINDHSRISKQNEKSDFFQQYLLPPDGINNFFHFPEIVAFTFAPTIPEKIPYQLSIDNNSNIKTMLTYTYRKNDFRTYFYSIISIALITFGSFIGCRNAGGWRFISLSSLFITLTCSIGYTIGLGPHTYLYSQNWQVPCLFILGSLLTLPFFKSKIGISLLSTCIILLALGDIRLFSFIRDTFPVLPLELRTVLIP